MNLMQMSYTDRDSSFSGIAAHGMYGVSQTCFRQIVQLQHSSSARKIDNSMKYLHQDYMKSNCNEETETV